MGDYMWGWGTAWYYAWWVEGGYYYEAASLKPIPGRLNYRIPVASTSATLASPWSTAPTWSCAASSTPASATAAATTTRPRTARSGRCWAPRCDKPQRGDLWRIRPQEGEGWEAYWYAHPAAIGILFRIIFGTRNVQSAVNANKDANGLWQGGLGNGVTAAPGRGGARRQPTTPTPSAPFRSCLRMSASPSPTAAARSTTRSRARTGRRSTRPGAGVLRTKELLRLYGRWERGILINKIV